MSLTFQAESAERCWDELYPLAQAHWASTESYHRHEPFNPSKERYAGYNRMGYFHLLTARDGARLAGYFGLYITDSMHSQLKMATEDTFYLHPDYRAGRNAWRMLRYAEQYCRQCGVKELLFSCEVDNTSGIHRLVERLDFRPVIMQYSKQISPPCADSAQPDLLEAEHVRTESTPCP